MRPGPAIGNAREHYTVCAEEIVRNVPRQIIQSSPSFLRSRSNSWRTIKRQDMADNSTVSGIQGKAPRLLLSRAETLAALRIGETTLHWLARTKKLNPVKIGARVLFSTA